MLCEVEDKNIEKIKSYQLVTNVKKIVINTFINAR